MRQLPYIVVYLTLVTSPEFIKAQTGQCHPQTMHACVGRDQFRECYVDSNGNLVPSETTYSCKMLNTRYGNKDLVCYGAAKTREEICGLPPPSCEIEGHFPVPDRCTSFYTCILTGNHFVQYINECDFGYQFHPRIRRCTQSRSFNCDTDYSTQKRPSAGYEYNVYVPALSTNNYQSFNSHIVPPNNQFNYNGQQLSPNIYQQTSTPYLQTTGTYLTTQTPQYSSSQQQFTKNPQSVNTELHSRNQQSLANQYVRAGILAYQAPPIIKQSSLQSTTARPVFPCPALTTVPDPKSCYHFYQCSRNDLHQRIICPFGLKFDTVRNECNANASCGSRSQIRIADFPNLDSIDYL